MNHRSKSAVCLLVGALLTGSPAQAEVLAMMNYETKAEDSLKTLKLTGPREREEGIAIVDVDPNSDAYGRVLMTIPLPSDLIAHHIFFDKRMSKAYVTALGKSVLHVIEMDNYPYRLKPIAVAECKTGEDVVFSDDNSTWYLTCMDSANVYVGDVATDTVKEIISLPAPYPHGIAVHNGIDRILVTSTVRGSDLGDPGETITVIEASTNKVLSSHKVSNKPSPSGEAPVEILFVPGSAPPVAYITNMFGGTLWMARWDPSRKVFDFQQAFDFGAIESGVPLEMYFSPDNARLYVTTAKPGHLHIFDIGAGPTNPNLVKSLPAAEGAHHVAFTRDHRYAFVQNSLLNLPGMSDGSITVVDLEQQEVVGSVDTLKEQGYNPNSIVLLPEWNDLAGH